MSGLTEARSGGKYLSIIQGRLRMSSTSENPKAEKRNWEDKDGNKGVKYELVYEEISGLITSVTFKDSKYGEQLVIRMKCGDDVFQIEMPSDSRYAMNFMVKCPSINFSKEVSLYPYDFEKDGKRNTGVKVSQGETVIKDYYYDAENKKKIHGIPVMENEDPDKDDWKVYFIGLKKFLKSKVQEQMASVSVSDDDADDLSELGVIPEGEGDGLPF